MKIQNKLKNISENGCLLFCYAYVMGLKEKEVIEKYEDWVKLKLINPDCYVMDGDKLINYMGCCELFTKYKIKSGVSGKGLYIACYELNFKNHFVVMKNDNIIYNSLDNSVCVSKGKLNKNKCRYIVEV